MSDRTSAPWFVSLHGGHSGEFCDHGEGTLREVVEAAVARGYRTFGVAEHAPRIEPRYLLAEEIAMGWDVAKLERDFESYARTVRQLAEEFADRLEILCGFEAEVVPPNRYARIMKRLRRDFGFDYMVGSVHWVDDVIVDYTQEEFDRAVAMQGGLEPFAVRYYECVTEMVRALKPEVVGHLDLIRKLAGDQHAVETPPIRRAAARTLDAIREHGCIIDVNTVALRRELGTPYPAPWLVHLARDMGIGFCFGDDSHFPADVGQGIAEAREYLLKHGVGHITVLERRGKSLARKRVPLV